MQNQRCSVNSTAVDYKLKLKYFIHFAFLKQRRRGLSRANSLLSSPFVSYLWARPNVSGTYQVEHLKDRYRCVTTDLPGFSVDDARTSRWGYSMDEVVKRLETTIEAAGNGEPVILVAHDWGW